MRLSVKIFPGVRISTSTRRRRRPRPRKPAATVWTHLGCSTRHRSQAAAQKCASAKATKRAKVAGTVAARTAAPRTTTAVSTSPTNASNESRLTQLAAQAGGSRSAPGPEFFHPFGEPAADEPARPAAAPASHSSEPPDPSFPSPASSGKPAVVIPPPDREKGWAHLYLASELARGIAEHEPEYQAHLQRLSFPSAEVITQPVGDLRHRLDQLREIVHRLQMYLAPELVKKGFGSSGTEGDDVTIRVVAAGITDIYVSMMRWAASLRGIPVPDLWRPLYQGHADLADVPIDEIRQFSTDWSQQASEAVVAVRAGLVHEPLHLTLRISIGDEAMANLTAAYAAVRAARR